MNECQETHLKIVKEALKRVLKTPLKNNSDLLRLIVKGKRIESPLDQLLLCSFKVPKQS